MEQPVLCKDCKHSFVHWTELFSLYDKQYTMRCRLAYKQNVIDKNFVTGHKIKPAEYERCSIARIDSHKGTSCGEKGQFWQPRHKQGLFTLIKHVEEIK